jgi:hypothetical protein
MRPRRPLAQPKRPKAPGSPSAPLSLTTDSQSIWTQKAPPRTWRNGALIFWSTRPGSNWRPPRWQETKRTRNRQYLRTSDRHTAAHSGVSRHQGRHSTPDTAPPRHQIRGLPPSPRSLSLTVPSARRIFQNIGFSEKGARSILISGVNARYQVTRDRG